MLDNAPVRLAPYDTPVVSPVRDTDSATVRSHGARPSSERVHHGARVAFIRPHARARRESLVVVGSVAVHLELPEIVIPAARDGRAVHKSAARDRVLVTLALVSGESESVEHGREHRMPVAHRLSTASGVHHEYRQR